MDPVQQQKPLFITTVPQGVFLEPVRLQTPPEVSPRKVYHYSSTPRILKGTAAADDSAAPRLSKQSFLKKSILPQIDANRQREMRYPSQYCGCVSLTFNA